MPSVREAGRLISVASVVAIGATSTGERTVFDTATGPSQDGRFCGPFLRHLVKAAEDGSGQLGHRIRPWGELGQTPPRRTVWRRGVPRTGSGSVASFTKCSHEPLVGFEDLTLHRGDLLILSHHEGEAGRLLRQGQLVAGEASRCVLRARLEPPLPQGAGGRAPGRAVGMIGDLSCAWPSSSRARRVSLADSMTRDTTDSQR